MTQVQKDFFDQEANRYPSNLINYPPLHTRLEISEVLKRLVKIKKGDYIADFGAGSGRLTIPLARQKLSIYAIDISDRSLKGLRYLAKQSGISALKISQSFPKNKKFQVIVGADILHHVNLDKYLPVIYGALKKGGKIVFSEPCAMNITWYLYLPFASSWKIEKGLFNCSYHGLKRRLENSGFKDVKITGLGFLPRPIFNFSKQLCVINDSLGNLPIIKFFAYRLIIEAGK